MILLLFGFPKKIHDIGCSSDEPVFAVLRGDQHILIIGTTNATTDTLQLLVDQNRSVEEINTFLLKAAQFTLAYTGE